MEEAIALVVLFVPLVSIVAGASIALVAMHHRGKLKELQVRERIAMIEKGLVPPPELNPGGFEAMLAAPSESGETATAYARAARRRASGILFIGLGLALLVLISIAGGSPSAGFGVGGAFVMLGAAFVAMSVLSLRDAERSARWRSASAISTSSSAPGQPLS